MGDSGEGLVDADARIQERIEERESERKRRGGPQPAANPDKVRELESLRLAKAELERQAAATAHPVRKQQIQAAIAEIDKRLAAGANASQRRRDAVPVWSVRRRRRRSGGLMPER